MHTFLGVPIVVHGEVWGNLYLTEKDVGEFTRGGRGGGHGPCRLGRDRDRQRAAVPRRPAAARRAAASEPRSGDDDGDRPRAGRRHRRRPRAGAGGQALAGADRRQGGRACPCRRRRAGGRRRRRTGGRRGRVERACPSKDRSPGRRFGRGSRSASSRCRSTASPRTHARRTHRAGHADGVPQPADRIPERFDRLSGDGAFSEEDERLLQAFAASAATAVATAQTASSEALQRSVKASEQERRRWARELHDETLQELAGLKVLLSGARRSDDRRASRRRRRPGDRDARRTASRTCGR